MDRRGEGLVRSSGDHPSLESTASRSPPPNAAPGKAKDAATLRQDRRPQPAAAAFFAGTPPAATAGQVPCSSGAAPYPLLLNGRTRPAGQKPASVTGTGRTPKQEKTRALEIGRCRRRADVDGERISGRRERGEGGRWRCGEDIRFCDLFFCNNFRVRKG